MRVLIFVGIVFRPALLLIVLTLPLLAQPKHVAPTDPQDPETQRRQFHLPPGFEIQLVLSEPDIGQPMNLNFDARGRLWVTSSIEYPFPARTEGLDPRSDRLPEVGDDSPSDWLTVASDFGPDGKPALVERFINGLNIPIGQTPMGDGSAGIVYSIGDISLYRDEDGDGLAEIREQLYSHFGNIDTHGMASSFRRWIDGWIYGCHGFRNTSSIVDSRGVSTELFSGHTYRFRPDGSRFEIYTRGQVNPFGLAIDPLGNVFSADCHSRPLYQLLQGAAYYRPSWGIPIDEPLGLAPEMIDHDHGSTAISGPAYYAADHFPEDYRDNLFLCNSVSRIVHRDKLVQHGSTLIVDTQPDFITCDDPWFRPVDATVGPDGALYIADFYNAVIGHYEVPLGHPKRDRTHGRVWRVVYKGSPKPPPDLTTLDTEEIIQILDTKNESLRVLATNQLVDSYKAGNEILMRQWYPRVSPNARAHLLWALERCTKLEDTEIETAMSDGNSAPRIHVAKILAERSGWGRREQDWALRNLRDENAFVQRAAAEGMRRHPSNRFLKPLFDAWESASAKDTHLIHVLRMAIREQLRVVEGWTTRDLPKEKLMDIASATRTAEAARFVMLAADPGTEVYETFLRTNAGSFDEEELNKIESKLMNARLDIGRALSLLGALLLESGTAPSGRFREWSSIQIENAFRPNADLERGEVELALKLAGSLRLDNLAEPLLAIASNGDPIASEAILQIDSKRGIPVVLDALAVAPAAQQTALAQILSGHGAGADRLLVAIEEGRASRLLLRDSLIRQNIGSDEPRLKTLLADLPDPAGEIEERIVRLTAGWESADRDFNRGESAFQLHCAACHSVGGDGGILGPNLDGVESRGPERLLEDILDPNRNVDPAFMLTTIRVRGGQAYSGIGARLEAGHYLLTDATGVTRRIPVEEVVEKSDSSYSLMPAALGSQISENAIYDILEFLLSRVDHEAN